MHFPLICRTKFLKFSLWCVLWGHTTEPLNKENSKKTESLGKNDGRQKCLDKSLYIYIYIYIYKKELSMTEKD